MIVNLVLKTQVFVFVYCYYYYFFVVKLLSIFSQLLLQLTLNIIDFEKIEYSHYLHIHIYVLYESNKEIHTHILLIY